MAAAEIFFEHERWGRNLAWSAGFHVAVAASILAYTVIAPGSRGEGWGAGGGGDAIGVALVSTVPLPANPVQTQNVLANESKGLSQSQPKPEVKEPEAIPIPEANAKKKSKAETTPTHQKPQPQPEPKEEANHVVPFDQAGPASRAYGVFSACGAAGGLRVSGGRTGAGSRAE